MCEGPRWLGWQCQDLCLSATPPKRQTFVSVADMLTMLAQHVGDILLSWPFFAGKVMFGNRIPDTLSYMYVGIITDEVI
jgi:hypothetical protein